MVLCITIYFKNQVKIGLVHFSTAFLMYLSIVPFQIEFNIEFLWWIFTANTDWGYNSTFSNKKLTCEEHQDEEEASLASLHTESLKLEMSTSRASWNFNAFVDTRCAINFQPLNFPSLPLRPILISLFSLCKIHSSSHFAVAREEAKNWEKEILDFFFDISFKNDCGKGILFWGPSGEIFFSSASKIKKKTLFGCLRKTTSVRFQASS